jgi:pyruvate dehydrogenase E2 component (dihydrolipoamide acetyltransferase)
MPGRRVKASPIARRIARATGVELATLSGSGPGGRIVRADVEAAAGTVEAGTANGDLTQRAAVPDFTITTEVDMEACVDMRARIRAIEPDVVPSFNDMLVKACAVALREHPRANAAYRDGRFELFSRVNVGIAVAAQDSLVVPTIFDADRKSLGEIAREARVLAGKVRDGTVTPPELSGGTFTVSDLGMYGVTQFNALIHPPQAAILAVGAIGPKPVVHEEKLVARNRITISLSCDHRVLYGADAAEFLARIRGLLEQPLAAFFIA